MPEGLYLIAMIVGIVLAILVVVGLIIAKTYQRASKEQSFVRTGAGGQKVVKDGGAVVFPLFHEIIPINMQTLRLTVKRFGSEGSLITKDRLRVDVEAEFYVRVSPDEASIATAAQTLGRRTLEPGQLSVLIEGKFVDALRAAAATMEMQDLHEKRADFVQKVQSTVAEDLKKNGLELESVSLTGLNQTDVKFFNPNNAFDAEGLAKLTQVTETRRQERNQIEADTRVAIETKNLEANSKSLDLKQQTEFATLEQERMVETRRAEQGAQLSQQRAESTQQSELARIAAEMATETAQVNKTRSINVAEAEAARDLELAGQDQRIKVAEKSEAESVARAKADVARGEAVKAAQGVLTVEATAKAERDQAVAVIAAETEAQRSAAGVRIRAAAELEAAESTAQAKERLIQADAKKYEVEADGQRMINEAANLMSPETMALQIRLKLIENLPAILEQMGKPIEKIDSFKVVHIAGNGLGGNGQTVEGETAGTSGNLPTDMTNALLGYRMKVPFVDELARTVGLDLGSMNGMVESAGGALGEQPSKPAGKPAPARKVRDEPLAPQDKDEIQRLAGIHRDDA
jgi:uncharacterized membrane protein YqiK